MAIEEDPVGVPTRRNFVLFVAIDSMGWGGGIHTTCIEGFSSRESGLAAGDVIAKDFKESSMRHTPGISIACFEKK